jgi:Fe-S-cluster-containing dehydrogenase component/anaerobic selenocysteine-containing dehydrogenase
VKDLRKDRGKQMRDRVFGGNEDFPLSEISRRRFLSLLSASTALALGSSCSTIDRGTIVPYTKRPGEIIPGVATWYASTFQEGWISQGVLVKTREGRPILIEGNPEHPVSRGTVSLRAMGDLLGLYDPDRLRAPSQKGAPSTWKEAEQALMKALNGARLGNRSVLLLTGAVVSPSQTALIGDLQRALPGLRHACWEPASPQSQFLVDPVIPTFHPERAAVILSLQSDFLGNDGNAPSFIRDFASWRRIATPAGRMNRLWVCEGPMTLTGANADERIRVKPSGMAALAFSLIRILNETEGMPLPEGLHAEDLRAFETEGVAGVADLGPTTLKLLAADLAKARKSALVLAGPGLPAEAHIACRLLNTMLQAEGNTVDFGKGIRIPQMLSNAELRDLLEEAAGKKYAAAIFWGANPAYAFPDISLWDKAVANIPDTFRIGLYEDETALDCNWRLPEHHWLESWGDFESSSDFISLRQPTIGALHDTRQGEDMLLSCMRMMELPVAGNYLEYMKARWKTQVSQEKSPVAFEDFWNGALHNGGVQRDSAPIPRQSPKEGVLQQALATAAAGRSADDPDEMELVLSPAAGVYDGRYANNGWLNELPDPVSKATWANPVSLSIRDAELLGVRNGDMVEVSGGDARVETPVLIQPGQCAGVASLALGYGRRTGNVAAGIGVNAYPLLDSLPGSPFFVSEVSIRRKSTPENRPIPITQTHDRMEGRDLARSWTLAEYARKTGEEKAADARHHASLVPEREYPGHKWGMAVDLSACVGCSACVVACQAENNIAVVGPERILKGRHMHWIRIDRYYEGDLRIPSVVHQPIFCQHCDDAPCEIVCPVNATTHSPDGLNQMAYNRCVGTRYCSNNCPFKVRRFNFFDYTSMIKEPESLVFNPEVTVRPRGVMEKCTFCVQRIQDAKQKAKVEGRAIEDGDIRPACAAACPAGAIVFGDLNDPESRVAKMSKVNRKYRMFEELGIKPSVVYLADVSNPAAGPAEGKVEA